MNGLRSTLLAIHRPSFQIINESVMPVNSNRTLQAYTPEKAGFPVLYLIK